MITRNFASLLSKLTRSPAGVIRAFKTSSRGYGEARPNVAGKGNRLNSGDPRGKLDEINSKLADMDESPPAYSALPDMDESPPAFVSQRHRTLVADSPTGPVASAKGGPDSAKMSLLQDESNSTPVKIKTRHVARVLQLIAFGLVLALGIQTARLIAVAVPDCWLGL